MGMRSWSVLVFGTLACLNSLTAETHWSRMVSSNFDLYTTTGERTARETIRYFEQVHSFFAQAIPHAVENAPRLRIVAFNSSKEYAPYRPNEFTVAYYKSTANHDYIVMGQTGADAFPIAIHEYVHLVVRLSKLNLPPWLNEGVAELYSTLKPMGDKILVGSLIPGRHQALLEEKWVPLATILAAGQDSPYYNEKDKAGSLYNEGWALTHMLALSPEYRAKYPQVMRAISDGAPSAAALEQTYGKPLSKIEHDLIAYLHGVRFQGILIPVKFEKMDDELKAEPAGEFDVAMLLAEIGDQPGKELATRKALESLMAGNPNRPEPYQGLGYLEARQNQMSEAREHFAKAYELGSRDGGLLWDYGRVIESSNPARSIEALTELLKQDPDRLEVRLELASVQLQSHAAKGTLETLAPVKKVKPEDAPRLLTLLAYANLEAGDRTVARNAASQLKTVSTNAEDRARADGILKFIDDSRPNVSTPTLARERADSAPLLKHQEAGQEPAPEPVPPMTRRPSLTGKFVELRCGDQARIVVDTAEGKKLLLIEDPSKLLVNGKSGETVDLTCGPQKAAQIRVEWDPPGSNRPGIDGIARAIHFDP
jgi:tetratricopeptide (TPR) repeat protein